MSYIHLFVRQNRRFMQKTVSYYCMHLTVAILVSYAITQNWAMSLAISLIEPTVQAFAYFFHERFWATRPSPEVERAPAGT